MKKIARWLAVIAIISFVVDWGIMGLKILDNNYLITTEAYIGLISLVVFFVCVLYLKLTNRCPIAERQSNPLVNTALTVARKYTDERLTPRAPEQPFESSVKRGTHPVTGMGCALLESQLSSGVYYPHKKRIWIPKMCLNMILVLKSPTPFGVGLF